MSNHFKYTPQEMARMEHNFDRLIDDESISLDCDVAIGMGAAFLSELRERRSKMMLDEYHAAAGASAIYPARGSNMPYAVLGLCGEAGEVAEKMKKCIRDNGGMLSDDIRDAIVKELGDVLWYVSAVAFELGVSLEEVAVENLKKLNSRKERGTLKGSGDDR